MNRRLSYSKRILTAGAVLCMGVYTGCISHLKTAKSFYLIGEQAASEYRMEQAGAAFKRALQAAGKEAAAHPSAQAFMMKGLAEMKLNRWQDAQASFSAAFVYGFEKGEEWARQLSLFGLASSFYRMGLEKSAFHIYEYILDHTRIEEIRRLAAQKYADHVLEEARALTGKKREKILNNLLKKTEDLTEDDLACGYYHYLKSQVLSHLNSYRESLEEAVMARELGLPSQELFRDNDNQIVFCFRELQKNADAASQGKIRSMMLKWTRKWGWPNPETPAWKKR